MHSAWTVHTLFITVKFVSQSQQMRAKKKKKGENALWRKRRRKTQSPNALLIISITYCNIFFPRKSSDGLLGTGPNLYLTLIILQHFEYWV